MMRLLLKLTASIFFVPLLLSCNSGSKKEKKESEIAYTEYDQYVTDFEKDSLSETELRAMQDDSVSWAQMQQTRAENYQALRQRVEQYNDKYEPEEQEEIQDLKDRYNVANENRRRKQLEASHRYKLRRQLLGMEIQQDDLSDLAPESIAATYERFIAGVTQNATQYETRDWNLIEGWWSALNSRYIAVEKDLGQEARGSIEKAKARYQEIRKETASR
ncbi:hypothetical protein MKJ04_16075 [Pontibacter sp. E15-1]|uniref:hypothetical protein n=1 Tax=Pontibacter sp. E15-1 TaxID=2919918 RepID=UPI001F4F43C9|nr:hypothetical protein [Pontibacter sp. E15-1]MCJ8166364.1 hypothetical protein [Pontibacter sp. E15-1]